MIMIVGTNHFGHKWGAKVICMIHTSSLIIVQTTAERERERGAKRSKMSAKNQAGRRWVEDEKLGTLVGVGGACTGEWGTLYDWNSILNIIVTMEHTWL